MDQDQLLEWRKQIILELLKHNVVYGKESIEDIINNAKKIEKFVFRKNKQQSSLMKEDALFAPKGTLIKIKGIPFILKNNALVEGTRKNLDYALSFNQATVSGCKLDAAQSDNVIGTTKSLSSEST